MADQVNRPWLDLDTVFVLGKQHKFPKNPEKWIPKFNPDEGSLVEDHIKTFMQAIRLRNVVHEDVVCRVFPYSFEGHASTWYFSLDSGTINSWDEFEKLFLEKIGDDNTPKDILMDLSSLRIKGKERVKEFNQRFSCLKNMIPTNVITLE